MHHTRLLRGNVPIQHRLDANSLIESWTAFATEKASGTKIVAGNPTIRVLPDAHEGPDPRCKVQNGDPRWAGTTTALVTNHTTRSTIIFLISEIALAGFSPLGQVLAQFMIVWQRYSLNGSSSASKRSPVASSRLSMIQR